jgi:hypothetical protein
LLSAVHEEASSLLCDGYAFMIKLFASWNND